ncbi:MAG: leucyl aminopeptidase [Pirellulales bacterium]
MDVTSTTQPLPEITTQAIVVAFWDDQPWSGGAAALDRATGGLLARLATQQLMNRKRGELTTVLAPPGVAAPQLVLVSLGARDASHPGHIYRAAAAAARQLSAKPRDSVVLSLPADCSAGELEALVAGMIFGSEGQDLYRQEKKQHPFTSLICHEAEAAALEAGRVVGQAVNLTRRLVNEPPEQIYPESFADIAAQVASQWDLECEIWDQRRLIEERCGSLLAVARGSARPPRLVQLRYRGGTPGAPTLALVGKGVTFDSGGYSIKPSDGMLHMKADMAGAATVLGALQAIATLKIPVNIIALMGLVENLVSSSAYKLGDVLQARNGKTIEVHNTDAEGRLVLADVLCVAVDQQADMIVDLATLTGACVVALGRDVTGLMTNHRTWAEDVRRAAERVGEPVWELPMFPEYDEQIKSEVADLKNVGDGRWGGAITGAKFLEQFVAGRPWVHLDIAGPAFVENARPWTSGGASGVMVRTLVQLARDLAQAQPLK